MFACPVRLCGLSLRSALREIWNRLPIWWSIAPRRAQHLMTKRRTEVAANHSGRKSSDNLLSSRPAAARFPAASPAHDLSHRLDPNRSARPGHPNPHSACRTASRPLSAVSSLELLSDAGRRRRGAAPQAAGIRNPSHKRSHYLAFTRDRCSRAERMPRANTPTLLRRISEGPDHNCAQHAAVLPALGYADESRDADYGHRPRDLGQDLQYLDSPSRARHRDACQENEPFLQRKSVTVELNRRA